MLHTITRAFDENNTNFSIFAWTFQMPNRAAYGRTDEDTWVVALLMPEMSIKYITN